jgi:major membrane immunogen (membrane-anchored lipoprotein)
MKKFTFVFIVVSTLLLNACKKDDTVSASNLSSGHSKVSLTAAGATSGNFSSNDLISIVAKSGSEINLSASYVNTTSFTTEIVLMLLPADITTGSYNFKTMSSSAALPTFAYTKGVNGWAATPSESEFTIVVSKATSTEIEGTFSGTLHNDTDNTDVTISNGKFAAKY